MKNFKNSLVKIFIKYFDYILLLLIISLFLGSFFGYFSPKFKKIRNIKDVKFAKGEEVYKHDSDYFEKLKIFYKEYESITEKDIEKIDAALPIGPQFHELFAGLESLFRNSGFELGDIALSKGRISEIEKQEKSFVKTVKINLVVNKVFGYQAYKKMLSILENNFPIIDIKSINYQGNDTYFLALTTYYLEEAEE
ncbi:MAG: hypothetical protein U9O66_03725 [Patescibacteria group bacterium]|nr:hypothetical protein [Patescibacteria group bacterium]